MRKLAIAIVLLAAACGSPPPDKSSNNVVVITDNDAGNNGNNVNNTDDAGMTDDDAGTDSCGGCEAPMPSCDGDTAVSYDVTCENGSCVLGQPMRTDCTTTDEICVAGQCSDPNDPCADVVCTTPSNRCVGNTFEEVVGTAVCNPETRGCEGFEIETTSCAQMDMVCTANGCAEPPPTPKRIFITAGRYTGDLATAGGANSGLAGADSICNTEAAAQSLGGEWKAWMSDSLEDAVDRIDDVGPWYLANNVTLVANNLAQLVTSGPQSPIDVLADGTRISGGGFTYNTWTGTRANGRATPNTCRDWTNESEDFIGWCGYGDDTSSSWTEGLDFGCHLEFRLFCVEQ